MAEIDAIKDYLKKLRKVINFEAAFVFFDIGIYKKNKIDDILCCIYAKLPASYKRALKTQQMIKNYNSLLCYNLLVKHMSKKFFLDNRYCVLRIKEINNLIQAVIMCIEKDINSIEKASF